MEVTELPLSAIRVSEFNTRKDLDAGTEDADIRDLADSIRENGLLNPITVSANEDRSFDIIAGQRRFLACQRLGMETIPAIVRADTDDGDATVLSLVENVHRAEMAPIDKARAYQSILDHYGSERAVAQRAGVTVPTVQRYLRLLELTPSLQDSLSTTQGPAGLTTMSRLAQTFRPEQQGEALQQIEGFNQDVQTKILNLSKGDLAALPALREAGHGGRVRHSNLPRRPMPAAHGGREASHQTAGTRVDHYPLTPAF